jgi:cystathionine gamma-synthase
MTGFGSILGVRPAGGPAAADAVVAAVRLWVPATSLGGVESTLERRRRYATEAPTVPEDLLRLSVGIEDVEDLWRDLDSALRAAAGTRG